MKKHSHHINLYGDDSKFQKWQPKKLYITMSMIQSLKTF